MTFQAYLDTIKAKTGMDPEDFRPLAEKKGLIGAKAGETAKWLKEDFGLGQGHAMTIWMILKADGGPLFAPADERLEKLFSGGRAVWRGTYDSLLATAQAWGAQVAASPADKYVSLTRARKKFAILQPSAGFLDIGIKRPKVAPTQRFADASKWNNMVTHRTRLAAGEAPDAEILDWLKAAFDAAG